MTGAWAIDGREPEAHIVGESLQHSAARVEQVAHDRWQLCLGTDVDLQATARLDEGWLLFDAPLPGSPLHTQRIWDLLRWNTTLLGGAKFAVSARSDHIGPPDGPPSEAALLRVRAELPLGRDIDLRTRIGETCSGLESAGARLLRGPTAIAVPWRDKQGNGAGGTDLRRLCSEAGWPFTERSDGRLAVDLDIPGGFHQAIVEETMSGAHLLRVSVGLGAGNTSPALLSQLALGVFLLRANAVVRMARAVAEAVDGRMTTRFEVEFAHAPGAEELGHALAALSVACRLCGREANVLAQDEAVAGAYLSSMGQSD